jgi:glycosyltransferase involved in cell wall biosynthesis
MGNAATISDEGSQARTLTQRTIKVLLIAPSLDILGGQAVQATRLIRELNKEPDLKIDFQPINPRLPAWLKKIPYLRTAVTYVLYCSQLLWRIPRYDLIHTFSAGLSSFFLWTIPAVNISRMYGKRFILNYRDGQAEEHLQNWRSAKPNILRATAIISPSDYVVDVFGRHGIPARRIFNIIDMSPFRYRQRNKLRPVFMTNRILEPLYNVGCVLRAFAIVQKKYPDASLTVAHDGVCRPELEALARELGLRNTKFIGRVPHPQVPDLYEASEIYMTSPNIDCMPGSLLECFASGVPVIATKAGGIPYIATHERTALLVDLNDHEAMAECAIRLLEDPDLVARMTRQAYEDLAQYRWDTIRQQWVDTYHALMARS